MGNWRMAMRAAILEEQRLLKMVSEHNFDDLQNYLGNKKDNRLLSPEIIKAAFRGFLDSNSETMLSSQKIIELLHVYVFDEKHKAAYEASEKHKIVFELFDLHERILDNKSPKGASTVSLKTAEEYSNKIRELQSDISHRRTQFKLDGLALLNGKAKQCLDFSTLQKLTGDTNYFQYITGYKERLINKRLDEFVANLPDDFFAMGIDYQTQTKELMVNKLFYTQIDLTDDEKFATFLLELFDKILNMFKEIALAEQEAPKEILLRNPGDLSFDILQPMSFNLKNATDTTLNNIAANYKRYITHLQNEGNMLDLSSFDKGDLKERLKVLDEYIKVIGRMNDMVDALNNPIIKGIKEHLEAGYGNKPIPTLEELEAKKSSLELAIKAAKEKEEVALIELFKGPEGDKLETNGLTKRQAFGLKLFKEAYNEHRVLPDIQKQFVQEFLVSSLGNMKLNGILSDEDKDLKYLTFKARNPEIFLNAVDKLIALQNKVGHNENISEEDKLNFREYGILMSYVDLEGMFKLLHERGLLAGNKKLTDLYEKIKVCAPVIKDINKTIEEQAGTKGIESGDLFLYNIKRKTNFLNGELTARLNFSLQITEHLHTTKLVHKKGSGKPFSVSHIKSSAAGALTEEFDIKTYLYADLYKINIIPLINADVVDKLKNKYVNDYEGQLNNLYRDIEFDLHKDAKASFSTSVLRHDIEYLTTWIAELIGYLGHNKLSSEGLDAVHKDIMNGAKEKNKMLCSEFAARTTVAAFIELNNRLKADLGIEEDVIKMPFNEKERFSKVHPDRLLKILKDAGCLEEIERTETEKKYLSFVDKVEAGRSQNTQSIIE